MTSLTATLVLKGSRKVMTKFCENTDLDQKVQSAQNSDSANRLSF
jgi:hypothetical protein